MAQAFSPGFDDGYDSITDLYWIGTTNTDWSNGANWSLSSGGAASGFIPDEFINAIFDTGSGANHCTCTAASACKSLAMDGNYSGNFSTGGFALTSVGSITFDGTGTLTLSAAVTISGDGNFHIGSGVGAITSSACTLTLSGTGNLDLDKNSTVLSTITCGASGKTTTFTGAGTSCGCSGLFTVNSGSLNCGAIPITVGSFTALTTSTIDFSTSAWSVGGSWTYAAGNTITVGTSSVAFTASATITSNGKSFYTVTATGGTTTLADALSVNSLTTSSTNAFTTATFAITAAAGISFSGSGALTLNGALTITGDGNFYIDSGVGAFTCSAPNVDLKGTGNFEINKATSATVRFGNLTMGYSGKTTTIKAPNGSTYIYFEGVWAFKGGAVVLGATNASVRQRVLNGNTAPITADASSTINVTANNYVIQEIRNTASLTMSWIPANLSFTNIYAWLFYPYSTAELIINMVANVIASTAFSYWGVQSQTGCNSAVTFNTANYNVSWSGYMNNTVATATAGNTLTFNFGSSTMTASGTGYVAFTADGTHACNVNLSTSTWSVAAGWTYTTGCVANAGTSSVAFTSTGTTTSASQAFYTVTCTGGTRTLGDNFSANTLTTSSTNAFTAVTYTVTTVGTMNFGGSGALTLANTCTVTGDGDFTIGAVGTLTVTGASIDVKGTGAIDITKTMTTYFTNITCAYNGKTTTITNRANIVYFTNILTVGAGGILTIAQSLVNYNNGAQVNPIVLGAGYTINGTATLSVKDYNASGAIGINIPAITLSGSSNQYLILNKAAGSGTTTFTLTGNISSSGENIIYNNVATGAMIFDTSAVGNYSITGAGFKVGSNSSSASTYNFNASVIACGIAGFNVYNTGTHTINAGTSTWTMGTSFVLGSNTVWNNGTSLTFNTAGAATLTTPTLASQVLPAVIVNKTGTFTLGSAISVASLTVTAVTTFSTATFALTSVGSIAFNGGTTLTLTSSTITMTGDGDFSVAAGITTITSATATLILQGTGQFAAGKNINLANITCAYSGKTTTMTGVGTIGINNGILTLGTGGAAGALVMNTAVTFYNNTTQTTPIVLNSGYSWSGTGALTLNPANTSPLTITFPALTCSTSGVITLQANGTAGTCLLNFTGNWVITGAVRMYGNGTGGATTFTWNAGLTFSCAALGVANVGASGSTTTFNFSDCVVTCTTFTSATSQAGNTTFNFQTSQWTVSGATWVFGSLTTPTFTGSPTAAKVTFTGATPTITFAGKTMPWVVVNISGAKITFSSTGAYGFDRLQCQAGKEHDFQDGQTCTVSNYTAGDWNGT